MLSANHRPRQTCLYTASLTAVLIDFHFDQLESTFSFPYFSKAKERVFFPTGSFSSICTRRRKKKLLPVQFKRRILKFSISSYNLFKEAIRPNEDECPYFRLIEYSIILLNKRNTDKFFEKNLFDRCRVYLTLKTYRFEHGNLFLDFVGRQHIAVDFACIKRP